MIVICYMISHVQRIRESLSRGKFLYHLNQSKKAQHDDQCHQPQESVNESPKSYPKCSRPKPTKNSNSINHENGSQAHSQHKSNGASLIQNDDINPSIKNMDKLDDDSVLLVAASSDDDDDLSDMMPIPSHHWSHKIGNQSNHSQNHSNTTSDHKVDESLLSDTYHTLNRLARSHDSNHSMNTMMSSSPVRIHRESISDLSSITSLRNSCVLSNTLKYGQPQSKFNRQLMVNRLRRKRKYQSIEREAHNLGAIGDKLDGNTTMNSMNANLPTNEMSDTLRTGEPPLKKSHKKDIDLMSSRDLKQELKRINRVKQQTSFNRRNLLLRKSVPNMSVHLKQSGKQLAEKDVLRTEKSALTASYDTRRIRNVMKDIFQLR